MLLDPREACEDVHHKNMNKLTFAQLNENSLCNKFEFIQQITRILMISERDIDSSFPSAQFHMKGYANPWKLDRTAYTFLYKSMKDFFVYETSRWKK